MKKYLNVFLLIVFAFALISCGKKDNFPQVDEKNRVNLTPIVALEKLSNVELPKSKVIKNVLNGKALMKIDNNKFKISMNGVAYNTENKIHLKYNSKTDYGSLNHSSNYEMYLLDDYYYVNLNLGLANSSEKFKIKANIYDEINNEFMEGMNTFELNENSISDLFDDSLIYSNFSGL